MSFGSRGHRPRGQDCTSPRLAQLVVAGLTLEHAQSAIAALSSNNFANAQVDVDHRSGLRTVQIYVVGDVQRPRSIRTSVRYRLRSTPWATPARRDQRAVRSHRFDTYRGKQLVREIDLYDFLLNGVHDDEERCRSKRDTLLVPPTGPQVAVSGMVKAARNL